MNENNGSVKQSKLIPPMPRVIPAQEEVEELREIEYEREKYEANINELYEFENHPFKVKENDRDMKALIASIRENGVMTPILVREREHDVGGYEIISGHRRKFACGVLGIKTIPAEIIQNCNNSQAIRMMVCSNLQRAKNKYSEMLKACNMMYDAMLEEAKNQDNYDNSQEEAIKAKIQKKVQNIAGLNDDTINAFMSARKLHKERLQELLDFVDKGRISKSLVSVMSNIDEVKWQEIKGVLIHNKKKRILSEGDLAGSHSIPKDTQNIKIEYKKVKDYLSEECPKSYSLEDYGNFIIEIIKYWHNIRKEMKANNINLDNYQANEHEQ